MNTIVDIIKRHFVSGVLVVVPLILTYILLRYLFTAVDDILQPLLLSIFGYYLPGLGVVTTLLLIILAGFFTRSLIGARLYRIGERLLNRVPLIRPIYSSAKRMLEAVTTQSTQSFKEVALVEYPRRGLYAMGFVSKRFSATIDGELRNCCSVFVGSTPTPVTGWLVIVPEDDITLLDMTVEEGIKFLVSGGVVSPDIFKPRTAVAVSESEEVKR